MDSNDRQKTKVKLVVRVCIFYRHVKKESVEDETFCLFFFFFRRCRAKH